MCVACCEQKHVSRSTMWSEAANMACLNGQAAGKKLQGSPICLQKIQIPMDLTGHVLLCLGPPVERIE